MKKNKMINDIIETLGNEKNFYKIIELSKIYKDINLNDFLHYCPPININFEWGDKLESSFYNKNINSLKSFKLKDGKLQSDISIFLYNIEHVIEMTFNSETFKVISGWYFNDDDSNQSIEFDLHSTNGKATTNIFSLYGVIIDEKIYKKLIRNAKYYNINNIDISLKKLVEDFNKHNIYI